METINALKGMDELYARGSSLNMPMEDMKQLLESSEKKENRNRIVFYIRDEKLQMMIHYNHFRLKTIYTKWSCIRLWNRTRGIYESNR